MMDKEIDWNGAKYLGELVLFTSPSLYGQPVYYTDGTLIPYTTKIPKFSTISAKDLTDD